MIFKNSDHESNYKKFCDKMQYLDCYHRMAAYLLALDTVCSSHAACLFNFQRDEINPCALNEHWQTGNSLKTTRLLFNLWNGIVTDGFEDDDGSNSLHPTFWTPSEIFSGELGFFYLEAVRIRFDMPQGAD